MCYKCTRGKWPKTTLLWGLTKLLEDLKAEGDAIILVTFGSKKGRGKNEGYHAFDVVLQFR